MDISKIFFTLKERTIDGEKGKISIDELYSWGVNDKYIEGAIRDKYLKQVVRCKKSEEVITHTPDYTIYTIIYTDIFTKRELEKDTNKTFTEILTKPKGCIFNCTINKSIILKKLFPKKKEISTKELAIAITEIWKQTYKEEIDIEEIYRLIEENIDKIQFKGRTEEYEETLEEIARKSGIKI